MNRFRIRESEKPPARGGFLLWHSISQKPTEQVMRTRVRTLLSSAKNTSWGSWGLVGWGGGGGWFWPFLKRVP